LTKDKVKGRAKQLWIRPSADDVDLRSWRDNPAFIGIVCGTRFQPGAQADRAPKGRKPKDGGTSTLPPCSLLPTIAEGIMATSGTSGASSSFLAFLSAANGSGAQGVAMVVLQDGTLTVTVDATGLQPGQHPMEIHGFANGAPSTLPTPAAGYDAPGSITATGAQQAVGPTILDLSLNPQNAAQGVGPQPGNIIPTADANGTLHYSETFNFATSAQAQAVLAALEPLGSRAIEIHGLPQPITDLASQSPVVGETLPVVASGLLQTGDHVLLG
jgi:hypothetical protein